MEKVKRSAVKGFELLYQWSLARQQYIDIIARTYEEAELLFQTAYYTFSILSPDIHFNILQRSVFFPNGSVLMFIEDEGA